MAVFSCAKTVAASTWVAVGLSKSGRNAPHFFRNGLRSTIRWSSAQASLKENPDTETSPAAAAAEKPAPTGGVYADQPRFDTLADSVSANTLKAITVNPMKLTHMSPVQAAVLPRLPQLAEPYNPEATERPVRDLLVKARTGTGKTLAFLMPAIEARLKAIHAFGVQAAKDAGAEDDFVMRKRAERIFMREHVGTVIMSPTRELATQIAQEAMKLTKHHPDFGVVLFVGGMSKGAQMRDWHKSRRDIVVSTPGRMRDFLESEPDVAKAIGKAKMLVLDEADTLLDMGFRSELDAIVERMPPTPERQTFLFSATVSRPIQEIARQFLDKNYQFIDCVTDSESAVHTSVPQYCTVVNDPADQLPHVLKLIAHDQLSNPGKSKVIVFLPTTKMTMLYSTLLRQLSNDCLPARRDTKVYEIHSKRAQDARTRTSNSFRNDTSGASVLVTSDVSARGVDYPGVTRVIQVGVPTNKEQYVHRIGRTGRGQDMGGRADLVILPWEKGFVSTQLSDFSPKSLSTDELNKQVSELAEKFDANPTAFVPHVPRKNATQRGPRPFKAPYTPFLNDIPKVIEALQPQLDEEAVKEAMLSMIGHSCGMATELRVSRNDIVEGCKAWAVRAAGLPSPPYISPSLLQRFGQPREAKGRGGSRDSRGSSSWSTRPEGRRPESRRSEWDDAPRRPAFGTRGDSRNAEGRDGQRGGYSDRFQSRRPSGGFNSDRGGEGRSNDRRGYSDRFSSGRPSRESGSNGYGGARRFPRREAADDN